MSEESRTSQIQLVRRQQMVTVAGARCVGALEVGGIVLGDLVQDERGVSMTLYPVGILEAVSSGLVLEDGYWKVTRSGQEGEGADLVRERVVVSDGSFLVRTMALGTGVLVAVTWGTRRYWYPLVLVDGADPALFRHRVLVFDTGASSGVPRAYGGLVGEAVVGQRVPHEVARWLCGGTPEDCFQRVSCWLDELETLQRDMGEEYWDEAAVGFRNTENWENWARDIGWERAE